jgi:isopenicillin N synthase-like dioxygenase
MSIPTIRLDDSNQEELVKNLRAACVDVGFFYVENHGVSNDLIEKVMEQMRLLFHLPVEEKGILSDKVMTRGYTAFEEEKLDPKRQSKGDTKEGFYIGKDIPEDSAEYNPAKLMGPNQWPSPKESPSMEDCQAFKDVMDEYRSECIRVGFRLVQLLSLAIGLEDEHYFDEDFADPLVTLRLLRYAQETSKPDEGVYACGAHSDYGILTLLLTDENAGLQILTKDKEWIDVPPKPFAFVINLGDMLERWTNGLFRSTVHRVLTNGDAERYSLPCFYDPHFDTKIDVLDICCSDDNPPKYPPTTVGGHLLGKYKQTHADFDPLE